MSDVKIVFDRDFQERMVVATERQSEAEVLHLNAETELFKQQAEDSEHYKKTRAAMDEVMRASNDEADDRAKEYIGLLKDILAALNEIVSLLRGKAGAP